jgi:hypothetical protein
MIPASGLGVALHRGCEVSRYRVTAATALSLRLDTNDGQPLLVEWGDGTSAVCASGATVSRTYATAYTGYVTVSARSLSTRTTRFDSSSNGWSFNLAALPRSVTYVFIGGSNTVTGNLFSIPSATIVLIQGNNTVTGNLSSILNATYVVITGNNTVTGNLFSIPSATTVIIQGNNTVTGNLSGIPNATNVIIQGNNTVTFSGSWTSATMRQVYVRGAGNIPADVCDALIIALAATATTWTNEKVINLKGSRTSASDAAYTTLQGRSVNITVN